MGLEGDVDEKHREKSRETAPLSKPNFVPNRVARLATSETRYDISVCETRQEVNLAPKFCSGVL
jgi:hypothetical protein